jgi:hypothetical protein
MGTTGSELDTRVKVLQGTTLTLHGHDTINSEVRYGTIWLQPDSALVIDDDLTITGRRAKIEGDWNTLSGDAAIIKASGGHPDAVLTIEPDQIDGDNSDPATSLVIDELVTIDVTLVNNAYVISTYANHTLGHVGIVLQNNPKSGTGYWIANMQDGANAGNLVVDCEIVLDGQNPAPFEILGSGSAAAWRTESGGSVRLNSGATFSNWNDVIRLDTGGTLVLAKPWVTTTDFVIDDGTLSIMENLDTTGNLEVSERGSVKVAEGKWAAFD